MTLVAKRNFIKFNLTILFSIHFSLCDLWLLKFTFLIDDGTLEVEFFARSMSKYGLNRMEFEISELAKAVGFNVISKDRNPAWKPVNDKFANDILEELKIYKPNARITAVHAGLECGVLLEKKAGLSACSIGPNIYSPHSTREHCEVASALFIEKVVRGIVKKYNS